MRRNEPEPRAFAEHLFDEFHRRTADRRGVTRESYGPGEQAALDLVEDTARDLGLDTEWDAAANLVVTLPGRQPELPSVVTGSHLDSVPEGGNYDGTAGVVAGMLALARRQWQGTTPRRNLKVLALRGEESAWFGKAYMGSSALLGMLSAGDLEARHRAGTRTLGEAMRDAGVAVDRVARGERLLDPATVHAFIELHIEQGPVMVARDIKVAMVTGIRGSVRHREIRCLGQAGHSGAEPRWLRHDAVLASAELLTRMDEHWRVLLERGRDLVMTAGIIHTDPADEALTRIPGLCRFSFDMRSQSKETLDAIDALLKDEAKVIGDQRGVRFEFDPPSRTAPAVMDEGVVTAMKHAFGVVGLPAERMPSGAGHDAANFANAGVPTGMLFVRNRHGSHNPDEAMEIDDFMAAAAVLDEALEILAS